MTSKSDTDAFATKIVTKMLAGISDAELLQLCEEKKAVIYKDAEEIKPPVATTHDDIYKYRKALRTAFQGAGLSEYPVLRGDSYFDEREQKMKIRPGYFSERPDQKRAYEQRERR